MSTIKVTQMSALTETTDPSENDVMLMQDAETGATQKVAYSTLLQSVSNTVTNNIQTTNNTTNIGGSTGINTYKLNGMFAKVQEFGIATDDNHRTESFVPNYDSYVNCHLVFQLSDVTTTNFDDSVCIYARLKQNIGQTGNSEYEPVPLCMMPISNLTAKKTYQIDLHCYVESQIEIYGGFKIAETNTKSMFYQAKLIVTSMTETQMGNYDVQRVLKANLVSKYQYDEPVVFTGKTVQVLSVETDSGENHVIGIDLSVGDDGNYYVLKDGKYEKNTNITTTILSSVEKNEPFAIKLDSYYYSTQSKNFTTIQYRTEDSKSTEDGGWYNIGRDSIASTSSTKKAYTRDKGQVAFDADDVVSVRIRHDIADTGGTAYINLEKLSQIDHNDNTAADVVSSKTQISSLIAEQDALGNVMRIKSKCISRLTDINCNDNAYYMISSHYYDNDDYTDYYDMQCGPLDNYIDVNVFYPVQYKYDIATITANQQYDLTVWLYNVNNCKVGTPSALTKAQGVAASCVTDVYLPSTLTGTLSSYGFHNNNNLTQLDSLSNTYLYKYQTNSIANNTNLQRIVFPYGTYSIAKNAVYNCAKLSSVTIPTSIGLTETADVAQTIDTTVFSKCALLGKPLSSNIFLMLSGNADTYKQNDVTKSEYMIKELTDACAHGLSVLNGNSMIRGRRMYVVYRNGELAKDGSNFYVTTYLSSFKNVDTQNIVLTADSPVGYTGQTSIF